MKKNRPGNAKVTTPSVTLRWPGRSFGENGSIRFNATRCERNGSSGLQGDYAPDRHRQRLRRVRAGKFPDFRHPLDLLRSGGCGGDRHQKQRRLKSQSNYPARNHRCGTQP